jgi:ATP-dependent DNA ligase
MRIVKVDETLVDEESGEIIAGTIEQFPSSEWDRDEYIRSEVKYLEPMTAQELEYDKLQLHINSTVCVAEQKFDGHRGLIHVEYSGNRAFSRRVSKETNWYSENTDCLPQIRDIVLPEEYIGTVIDGEVLLPIKHCTCREVQSVTGSLSKKAIENQLEVGFAYLSAFDCLYYKGINIMRMPYWKRKLYLLDVVTHMNSPFVKFCPIYATPEVYKSINILTQGKLGDKLIQVNDYNDLFIQFLKEDKEGLIIKDINAIYEQKRTKSFVKMKAHKTYDCVIMRYEEPTMEIDENERKTSMADWQYWYHPESESFWEGTNTGRDADEQLSIPVTKFACKGWIGAIVFGVWKCGKLIEVGRASGMDDGVRKLISENRKKYLGTVVEIEAQGIINKETGSLQHPRFVNFRPDKGSEQCTFNAHIRENKEELKEEE